MKFLTTLFVLLFTLSLSAQYQKGNLYLDGGSQLDFLNNVGNSSLGINVAAANASQFGYFFTDRLLVGTSINAYNISTGDFSVSEGAFQLQLKPFVRYYFPAKNGGRFNFFGDVGFGTQTFSNGFNSGFETDFHFGGGAEIFLQPGIVGTVGLQYDANASGLNFTNLNLGLNVLLGQLENSDSPVALTSRTVTIDPNVGQISYGRMGANGEVNNSTTVRLTPKVGFFLTNNLLVEGKASIVHNGETRNIGSSSFQPNKTQTTEIGTGVDLRYYPIHLGRFLPFATLGGGVQFLHQSSDSGFGTIKSNVAFGNWQAGLGASFFLSPHLSLDGAVTYQRTSIQLLNGESFNFRVSNYVALNVGFKYYLPAK
jgi:hypothetical protein